MFLIEPFPSMAILVCVCSCSHFSELPFGPRSLPTKLYCNEIVWLCQFELSNSLSTYIRMVVYGHYHLHLKTNRLSLVQVNGDNGKLGRWLSISTIELMFTIISIITNATLVCILGHSTNYNCLVRLF